MFVLEFFTGGHCVGIYTTLEKAKAAYTAHCNAMEITQPAEWEHRFLRVWYIADVPAIENASITEIAPDAPMPFV